MKVKRLALLLCALGVLWFSTFWLFFYLPPRFGTQPWNADLLQRSLPVGNYRVGNFFASPTRLSVDLDSGRLVREPKTIFVVGESSEPRIYEQHRPDTNEIRHPGEWKRYKHWRKPVALGDKPVVFRFPCTPKSAGNRYAVGLSWNGDSNVLHWVDLESDIAAINSGPIGGYRSKITLGFSDPGRVVVAMSDSADGPWKSRLYAIDGERLEQLAEWEHVAEITHWRPSYLTNDGEAYVAYQEDLSGELVLRTASDGTLAKRVRVLAEDLMSPRTQFLCPLENGLVPVQRTNGGTRFYDCFLEDWVDQRWLGAGEIPSLIFDDWLGKPIEFATLPNNKAILTRYEGGQLKPIASVTRYPLILPANEVVVDRPRWGGQIEIYSAEDGSLKRHFTPLLFPVCGAFALVLGWGIWGWCWTLFFCRSPYDAERKRSPRWHRRIALSVLFLVILSLSQTYLQIWEGHSELCLDIMLGIAIGSIVLAIRYLFFGRSPVGTRSILLAFSVTFSVLVLSRSYHAEGGHFVLIGLGIAPVTFFLFFAWLGCMIRGRLASRIETETAKPEEHLSSESARKLSMRDLLLVTGSIAILLAILTPWFSDIPYRSRELSFWICCAVFTAFVVSMLVVEPYAKTNRLARYGRLVVLGSAGLILVALCFLGFPLPTWYSVVGIARLYGMIFSSAVLTIGWTQLWISRSAISD